MGNASNPDAAMDKLRWETHRLDPAGARDVDGPYAFKTTDVGNLVLALSNHGFMGNNFAEREASMEYPKGSEIDHMVRGGIWIGGVNVNLDTLVTTGVQDGYWGSYNRPTEWQPLGFELGNGGFEWILEYSTLPTSPYYQPLYAISEQDYIAVFDDLLDHPHTPVTGNADDYHNATGLMVFQESYAWSYEPADAMVLVKWTLVPDRTLQHAYVGLYSELTTGWKGKYPIGNWPPSSANWFHHHQLYWVDDLPEYAGLSEEPLNLLAEHHMSYDDGDAPQHAGIKFLGIKRKPSGGEWEDVEEDVAWHWWDWEPGSLSKDNDSEKYEILSAPGTDDWSLITPSPDNSGDSPISLFCIGPMSLYPAPNEESDPDLIEVTFALLAGDNFDDLVQNALYAQTVYNFNFTVPTPPFSPRLHVETDGGRIRILWEDDPESSIDPMTNDYDFEGYRVYIGRSDEEASFDLLAQFDLDRIPAKNPVLDSYFTRSWLESQVGELTQQTGQEFLNLNWPDSGYLYQHDEVEPFLVMEPDSIGYNTGLAGVELSVDDWVVEEIDGESVTYKYAYEMDPVSDGHHYWVSVTSYDLGNPETPSLESGLGQNVEHVIPGLSPASAAGRKVTVFPNPYRGSAVWDSNRATGRYIWFAGLPAKAQIKVFTLAGDLVAEIDFDRDTYRGENAAGVLAGADAPLLSGTMAAWDLRSFNGQPVATGLYLFSVTDRNGGETQQGKFLVLK